MDKRAVKSEDTTLQNLIQGHILFFQQLDDVSGYQKWLKADESFVIEAPKDGSFQKDVPYKVTIYWIWPQYFRNYVYTQKSTQGDLVMITETSSLATSSLITLSSSFKSKAFTSTTCSMPMDLHR